MYYAFYYFLLFIIYAVVGYLIETVVMYYHKHRFVNRGFLRGPYLPIYGWGGILMHISLQRYVNDPAILFVLSMFLFGVLEYFTSYIMEKLFNARWWDYSDQAFNLNGRIKLGNLFAFGLLGIIATYLINPVLLSFLNKFSSKTIIGFGIIILIVFLLDNFLTFKIMFKVRTTTKLKNDSTEIISKKVEKEIRKLMKKYETLSQHFNNYLNTKK